MITVIILGIVQGIAEFLPISSSAHLILVRDIFGLQMDTNIELTFDLALHFGTLLAIIIFFFKDLLKIGIDGVTKGPKTDHGKIFWYLLLATIPAGIIGVAFEDVIDTFFRDQTAIIALALIFVGILLYVVDKLNKQEKEIKDLKWYHALLIGCAQTFALIPGFSRSGTTITAARLLKLTREESAKFSFYLAIPVVAGATLYSLIKPGTLDLIISNLPIFSVGIIVSFITGYLCIAFLLKFIKKNDFKVFMIYRIIVGLAILLWLFI